MSISVLLMVVFHYGVHGPRALSLVVVEPYYDHDPVQTLLLYLEVKTALVIPSKLKTVIYNFVQLMENMAIGPHGHSVLIHVVGAPN